tara:strand:- start:1672 stop:2979 length:1308 start_codon:yes stop_codon:yes gene_type:complete
MTDILKSLLEKQNTGRSSWYDIANAWSQSNKKSTKSLRNILIGQTLFGMKEMSMQNQVMKNLRALDQERIFDLGGMNQKWEAYQGLIKDEKAYKADSNYFKKQALAKYTEMHPDFDMKTALDSEIADRNKEIDDYAKALLKNHQTKTQTGNFNVKINKEQFFQPFNDYYNQRAEEINAPKNRSLVHAGWNKITQGRKKVDPTAPTLEERRKTANRGNFGYLLDPDEIKPADEIAMFRDPDKFTMTNQEVKAGIISLNIDNDVKQQLISGLDNGVTYTREELQDYIAIGVTNFDPVTAKLRGAYKSYDALNNIDDTNRPVVGTKEYKSYVQRRNLFAMQEAKIGNQRENQFLQLVYNYQDALEDPDANKDLLAFYKSQISAYTQDDIDKAIMNQISVMVADPEFNDRNEDKIEEAGGINKFFENYAKNFRQIIESI